MFIPNADRVTVPKEKICGYLLSTSHPAGQSKAVFFLKFGFKVENWRELAIRLECHARDNPVAALKSSTFGTRYVVDGLLLAPNGVALNVRSVWFITRGTEIPRFTTAHPLKRILK